MTLHLPVPNFAEATLNNNNSASGYVQFAHETVQAFLVGNGGQMPSLDFVMTHLRHSSLILGHKRQSPAVFATVAAEMRAEFPALDDRPPDPASNRRPEVLTRVRAAVAPLAALGRLIAPAMPAFAA